MLKRAFIAVVGLLLSAPSWANDKINCDTLTLYLSSKRYNDADIVGTSVQVSYETPAQFPILPEKVTFHATAEKPIDIDCKGVLVKSIGHFHHLQATKYERIFDLVQPAQGSSVVVAFRRDYGQFGFDVENFRLVGRPKSTDVLAYRIDDGELKPLYYQGLKPYKQDMDKAKIIDIYFNYDQLGIGPHIRIDKSGSITINNIADFPKQ